MTVDFFQTSWNGKKKKNWGWKALEGKREMESVSVEVRKILTFFSYKRLQLWSVSVEVCSRRRGTDKDEEDCEIEGHES